MKSAIIFIVLFLCASQALTQPSGRRLPPSLERELQLRGGTRVTVFSDTLKAKARIAASIRDTAMEELDSTEVSDSAIVVVDSAVSISHKRWLDASIAELPEYRTTEGGPRFLYPLSILIDTRRRTIPFDSTLPQQMQVAERERLTASDALPLTKPITPEKPIRLLFEAGIGTVSLPMLAATAHPISTPTVNTTAGILLQNNSEENAMRSRFGITALAEFFFPLPNHRPDILIPQLDLTAEYQLRNRLVRTRSDSDAHSISRTRFGASYRIGELTAWRLDASGSATFMSDEVLRPLHESSGALSVAAAHEGRSFRIGINANYESAGELDIDSSVAPSAAQIGAALTWIGDEDIEIGAGLGYASAHDVHISRGHLLPHAFFKWQQSPFTLFSASVARSMRLATLDHLADANVFYSAVAADSMFFIGDPRRAVLEPLRIAAGVDFTVSLAERISTEVRYIMSEDEPVFELLTDSAGKSAFVAKPYDTRKFEAEGKVRFLVFGGDEVNASVMFASSTIANEERSMPFAPTVKGSVAYSMKSLFPTLLPIVEFSYLARPDKSISLINAEASYRLSEHFVLFARGENLFNAASDFWTGYADHPRNLVIGVKGKF